MSSSSTVSNTWTVVGMTCEHCVASVTEEVSELPGVQDVQVDLGTGEVVVTSVAPLDHVDLASAVADAGYALA